MNWNKQAQKWVQWQVLVLAVLKFWILLPQSQLLIHCLLFTLFICWTASVISSNKSLIKFIKCNNNYKIFKLFLLLCVFHHWSNSETFSTYDHILCNTSQFQSFLRSKSNFMVEGIPWEVD
jgi:hypothetical protein